MNKDSGIILLLIIVFVVIQAVLFPLRFSACENSRVSGLGRAYYKSVGGNNPCEVETFLGFRLAGYPHLLHNEADESNQNRFQNIDYEPIRFPRARR